MLSLSKEIRSLIVLVSVLALVIAAIEGCGGHMSEGTRNIFEIVAMFVIGSLARTRNFSSEI